MKAQRTSERVQGRGRVVGGARGGRAKCYNFKPDSHALFSDEYRSLSVFASSFPPPPLFSFPFSFSFSFRSSSASLEPYEPRSKSAPEISPNFRTVSFDDIEIDPPKVSNYFVTEGNRLNRVTLREEGYERKGVRMVAHLKVDKVVDVLRKCSIENWGGWRNSLRRSISGEDVVNASRRGSGQSVFREVHVRDGEIYFGTSRSGAVPNQANCCHSLAQIDISGKREAP